MKFGATSPTPFDHIWVFLLQMLMIRDYWVCWVISIMFEVLEYSLEHQLPNFAECWWDHVSIVHSFVNRNAHLDKLGQSLCLENRRKIISFI